MKNKIISFIWFLLIVCPNIKSQDTLTMGVGISLNPNFIFTNSENVYYSLTNPTSFYLIFNISNIRFEPEFGYYTYSNDYNYDRSSETQAYSTLRTGLRIFCEIIMESSFKLYAGPRLGLIFTSSKFSYTGAEEEKTTELDFISGICTGGEYLFSQHFSIGGEVQLNYIILGEPESSHPGFSSSSRSASETGTNTEVFFRWYF
ncbi:MAG TPA: hypothetical protein VMT35_02480 [Ignavibacteriaceae bacterium]|nr:hypothetical protein [Ignavibacteriaceae bacterium]